MAVTLIVKIQVENFEQWKTVFDEAVEFRKRLGIEIKGIYQSLDDERSISLISEYPSLEVAKAMLANPEWKSTQKKAGVIGGFDVTFCNSIPFD
ncbi:hypothetical protein [Chryseobacterium sp.]|uniref:hypothetical protein n=1 Tax=Chryseobacterium sp. TaxID=1871047 RepID=UPI0011C8A2D9|nr:hypothetical protein [Chryseobacterium sp.]TXF79213.1 hypothetical protein FUA25_02125 [Chryseobacterium sp.]